MTSGARHPIRPRFVGAPTTVREVERVVRSLTQRGAVAWRRGEHVTPEVEVSTHHGSRPLITIRTRGAEVDAVALLVELQNADERLRGAA